MDEKIIFAGTPDFAAEHLQALIDAKVNIVAVYTQPDRPANRGHKLTPSPVKELALKHNLKVFTPENFKSEEDVETFKSHHADLAIVVAYGLILPQSILDAPRLGCINVHGSLLPKWRGAAPIQRALLSGEKETGVTIMQLVKELDAGDMLATAKIEIKDTDTSLTLFERLAKCGAQALVEALPKILKEELTPVAQDKNLVTYASKLSKDEAPLDFNKSANELDLQVRGLNPWPIATASFEGITYKIFESAPLSDDYCANHDSLNVGSIVETNADGIVVKCAKGLLLLVTIQAPGKGRVKAADLARSRKELFVRGKVFG